MSQCYDNVDGVLGELSMEKPWNAWKASSRVDWIIKGLKIYSTWAKRKYLRFEVYNSV